MSGLIDRQQAIDVLEERLQANGYSNVALVSELNRSIGYLMQLPSVQPEQQWIPVTEILPENDDKVLITHSHGISMAWWNGRYWTGSMIKKYKTVTAWMPLPEPYKEVTE